MARCGGTFILPTEKEKKQEGFHIEILGLRHWIVLGVYLIL
jgi:hypothetical protein